MNTVKVFRVLPSGTRGLIGTAYLGQEGWRFVPAIFGRERSRRAWPNWEASVPRWVGYPSDKLVIEKS